MSEGRYVQTELGVVWQPATKTRKQTPHSVLKRKCREALTVWRHANNAACVLLPSIVGKIQTQQGKDIFVGKRGQADDMLLVWGCAIAIEYKAGADRQSDVQRAFQARWIAAGGHYVLCRKPTDLTDALAQIAAMRGELF